MSPLGAAILAPFLLVGCALHPVQSEALPDSGNPALHAVHDARLRYLMDAMNTLMFERMRTELELDRDRRQQALQIAEAAASMRGTLGEIIDALPGLSLSNNEKIVFLTLAEALQDRAKTLERQARANAVDVLPGTFERMRTTCVGCHQLFRKRDPPPKANR